MSKVETITIKPTVQGLGPPVPAGESAKAGSRRSSANDCRVSEEGSQSSGASHDWRTEVGVLARSLAGKLNDLHRFTESTRNVHLFLKDGVAEADCLGQELCDLLAKHSTTEASKEVVVANTAEPSIAGAIIPTPEAPRAGKKKRTTAAKNVSRHPPKAKVAVVAKPEPRAKTQVPKTSAERPPPTAPRKARSKAGTPPAEPPTEQPPRKTPHVANSTPETSKAGGPMEGRKQQGGKAARKRRRCNPAPDPDPGKKPSPSSGPGTKGRKRLNRVPTAALLIKKAPTSVEAVQSPPGSAQNSFADVIRRMTELACETSPTLTAKSVSRTRKGDLLIRVESAAYHQMAEIATKAAGPGMVVDRLFPKRTVVLKDLDLSITSQDVSRVLGAALEPEDRDKISVHSLRPGHDGTQCCTVSVPDTGKAKRLIKDGRVRIGLVMCRVRERRAVLQCYRCLDFGHSAHGCKAVDRSKLCRKCMQAGHKMGSCPNDPWCPLCAAMRNGSRGAAHLLGGRECMARKTAVSSRT